MDLAFIGRDEPHTAFDETAVHPYRDDVARGGEFKPFFIAAAGLDRDQIVTQAQTHVAVRGARESLAAQDAAPERDFFEVGAPAQGFAVSTSLVRGANTASKSSAIGA